MIRLLEFFEPINSQGKTAVGESERTEVLSYIKRLKSEVKSWGVLPYMGYMDMCRCEGYGFQAVYSRIGYINQSFWV